MGKREQLLFWKLARLHDMQSEAVGYGPVSYAVVKESDEFYLGRCALHPTLSTYMHLAQASIPLVVGRGGFMITSLGMNPSRVRRAPAGE